MKYLCALFFAFSQIISLSAMDGGEQTPAKSKKSVSFLNKPYEKRTKNEKAEYKEFYKDEKYDVKNQRVDDKIRIEEYTSINSFHYYLPEYDNQNSRDLCNREARKNNENCQLKIYKFMAQGKYTTTWQDASLTEHELYANELKMELVDYYAFVCGLIGKIITEQTDIIANKTLPASLKKPAEPLTSEELESLSILKKHNETHLDEIHKIIDQLDNSNSRPQNEDSCQQIEDDVHHIENNSVCPGFLQCIIL